MEDLIITNNDSEKFLPTVSINFSEGVIEISGEMHDYIDETREYLAPFFKALDDYFQMSPSETLLIWRITYHNRGCITIAKDILNLFETYQQNFDTSIRVEWYYLEDELDIDNIKERGEELKGISKLNFEVLPWSYPD